MIKIYLTKGGLIITESGSDILFYTPSMIRLWSHDNKIGFYDKISNQLTNFGNYTDIMKGSGTVPSSLTDALDYLSSLFHYSHNNAPAFDISFSQQSDIVDLNDDFPLDDFSLLTEPSSGIIAGDYIRLYESVEDKVYYGSVVSVSEESGYDEIEMDTDSNFTYKPSTTTCSVRKKDLAVNASPVIPQRFIIENITNTSIEITRIMFQITCSTAIDFSKFGNLSALIYGVQCRTINPEYNNLFNVKTNGDLIGLMYDFTDYDAIPGLGTYGIGGRLTYGGDDKHDMLIKLHKNEKIEIIEKDNLSGLLSYKMSASGRYSTI